jgi:hypothetical protein
VKKQKMADLLKHVSKAFETATRLSKEVKQVRDTLELVKITLENQLVDRENDAKAAGLRRRSKADRDSDRPRRLPGS